MNARPRPESGETLVEILVTVIIMGLAFVALLGGIGTAAKSSHVHREEAGSEASLRSYAEALLDPTIDYVACATTATYAAVAAPGLPSGYSATITEVRYWDGGNPVHFVASLPSCPDSDNGVQQLTLEISSRTAEAIETLEIVKATS